MLKAWIKLTWRNQLLHLAFEDCSCDSLKIYNSEKHSKGIRIKTNHNSSYHTSSIDQNLPVYVIIGRKWSWWSSSSNPNACKMLLQFMSSKSAAAFESGMTVEMTKEYNIEIFIQMFLLWFTRTFLAFMLQMSSLVQPSSGDGKINSDKFQIFDK